MSTTPRLNAPYILSNQTQKEITHNLALNILDALVQPVAKDRDLSAPPGSPAEGDVWIVGAGASGAWSGQEKKLAQFIGGAWGFYAPAAGYRVYIEDEGLDGVYDGADWQVGVSVVTAVKVGGNQVVGSRQAAIPDAAGGSAVDAEARTALNALLAACRSHGLIAS